MSYLIEEGNTLASWIRKEIELDEPIERGSHGKAARRVQEWLNLHNLGLAIDGDFGRITEFKVRQFQEQSGFRTTGIVDPETYQALVAPIRRVLSPNHAPHTGEPFCTTVLSYAQTHLQEHPREVGGQNRGPWVRLYMKGHEGTQWAWCAGFVTFLMKQAEETLEMTHSIPGSFSCDSLAAQAKNSENFISESDIRKGKIDISDLSPASIFLVRRTDTDWTHTGFVTQFNDGFFDTIEGNTNDDGDREGYEVCVRTRGFKKKDFILL